MNPVDGEDAEMLDADHASNHTEPLGDSDHELFDMDFGMPEQEEEDPFATEEKVRELIKRKLRITREIPFNRVTRVVHGPEFRGHKPIQVRSNQSAHS